MTREEAIKYAEAMKEKIQEKIGRFGNTHAPAVYYSDLAFLSAAISALREQEQRRWIPVTERLPENEVAVLIFAQRRYCKGCTVPVISMGFHTDGKMNTEESAYNWDYDLDMQYDEENNAYIVPEGWWENVNYGEEFSGVHDFVTHWMPLPEPPKEDSK